VHNKEIKIKATNPNGKPQTEQLPANKILMKKFVQIP